MPTPSNNASPVKRPGLGRRAVSSHAVVTRSASSSSGQAELSNSHTSQPHPHGHQAHKAQGYRPHRAHLVGGGHRSHGRNPSLGKNLGKFQRHVASQQFAPEYRLHHHQRKKSAPVTPVASPPRQHVHWDGVVEEISPRATGSMKKNYSSPALRRSNSSVLPKKALVTAADRPHTSSGKKKTVGFELADSTDEGEWEDTTQSPESTRRSSVAQSLHGDENPVVLIDPLTFVKRPYPQFPRATSLPETSRSFRDEGDDDDANNEDNDDDDDDEHLSSENEEHAQQANEKSADTNQEHTEESARPQEHGDIATRLLSPSHSAKAPPAMSSISATAMPPPAIDAMSRNASLTNMAASNQDSLRRPTSSANIAQASTPTSHAQVGSSSIDGGVSRFIKVAASRTDSESNTPSSFLPHYHPNTPPSPKTSKKPRGSPSSRQPGTEPASRTQQKLWLQRTAALNDSPPNSHGTSSSVSPAIADHMSGTGRVGPGSYDTRGLVNGSARSGGGMHQSETKHIRKAYEKTAMELTVVRRFQSPTSDSFTRLNAVLKAAKSDVSERPRSGLGQPIKSAPALVLLQRGARQLSGLSTSAEGPETRQLIGRKQADAHDPEDPPHPSHRLFSTSVDASQGTGSNEAEREPAESPYLPSESEMMIRRMWESREVASSA